MELTVARVGKAHGLRGEVALDVRTDDPERRLAVGAVLGTRPDTHGPLTILARREHQGRLLVELEGVTDRTTAEALRGAELVVEADVSDEEDAWYPHELAGLRAEDPAGRSIGTVEGLEHLPAHDVLVLREPDGTRTLVPFVRQIVPVVDVAGGRVVVDAPGGLLAADAENLEVALPEPGSGDGATGKAADAADGTADGED
ncbi:ribosome maturation factor RimM [Cellulosimicrobium terreum]|nr:ribosome maturation factor RimM [Cellulosimicrobium terreum]